MSETRIVEATVRFRWVGVCTWAVWALASASSQSVAQSDQAISSTSEYAQLARACRVKFDTAPAAAYPDTASTPVTFRLLEAVSPIPATDGFIHLSYAAQSTSVLMTTAHVDAITPVDPEHAFAPTGVNSVMNADGADITGKIRLFNQNLLDGLQPDKTVDFSDMPGGSSGTTFFDVRYARTSDVPRFLSHRIAVHFGSPVQTVSALSDPVVVGCPPVVLSPPLVGHGWWNANGCCALVSPHRGAILPLNGDFRTPETFAIDFVQLNQSNGCCDGPVGNNGSWQFFGAPVLAAANGRIAEVVDGLPEQTPGSTVGVTIANAGGNRIIENIGDGRYILYAHFREGSVSKGLHVGSLVRSGQKLGEVGNSGSSTAPHLHFQVMDRPTSLNASGLPFVFDTQRLEGVVVGSLNATELVYEAGGSVTVDKHQVGWQSFRMPAETQVFGFNLR